MAKKHTWVGEILHGEFKQAWSEFKDFIGGGKDVEDALEKGWDKLEPEFKDALVNGSALVDTVAKDLDAVPEDVISEIEKLGIPVDEAKEIFQGIQTELTGVEVIPGDTIAITIKNLQDYLKTKKDGWFHTALSQAAQIAAAIISPTSAIGKIVSWIEMAYRVFVKK